MKNQPTPKNQLWELTPDMTQGRQLVPLEIRAHQRLRTPDQEEASKQLYRNRKFLGPHRLKLIKSQFFWDGVESGHLSMEWAQEFALSTYRGFRNPLHHLSQQEWVDIFTRLELMNGVGLRVGKTGPEKPVKYYRGAAVYSPHGLSWTPYFDMAAHFATIARFGAVFEIEATPSQIIHAYSFELDGREYSDESLIDSRDFAPKLIARAPRKMKRPS